MPMPQRLQRVDKIADDAGALLVRTFHLLALFAIGGATVWSAGYAFWGMVERGVASVEDILLLFIYLELGAMVGIYFRTNRLPVRFLIYVAITALTRMMISALNVEHQTDLTIIYLAGAILMLSIAVIIMRYASFHYPMANSYEDVAKQPSAKKRR